LVVIGVLLAAAAGVAFAQRRGVAHRRRPWSLPGVEPGVALFVSTGCTSCTRATAALQRAGVTHRVIEYESQPDLFHRLEITRVPAVAKVEEDGKGWISFGVPSPARLARWITDP
jgi:hypothetical protein